MTTVTAARSPAPLTIRGRPLRRANQDAEALTGRPYISHSQLALFRGCPRKFAFHYVEKATPAFQASSLLFGSAMHAAIEFHFRRLLEGLVTSAADMLYAFLASWEAQQISTAASVGDIPIRFNKGEDMGTVTAMAERMIAAFLASPISHPVGQIVGIEEQFRVVLDDALPDILAKVDLVTQTADSLHVVDLKTSRSKWSPDRAAEGAEQLLLYGCTLREMSEGVGLPVRLHFAVITKAKTPVVQVLEVPASEGTLASVHENASRVWQTARAGNFYPSPSPLNCCLCPFKDRCPAFGGHR